MEYTKGVLIINEYCNGFINSDNKRIYITKNNLGNAFHGENVEVEYYEEENIYHGKVINYSLINKIFVGYVYDDSLYDSTLIYVHELTSKNLIIIKNIYLNKKTWVKVIITSEKNNILTGYILEIIDNNLDNIIEKKFNIISEEYINYKSIEPLNIYKDQTMFDTFTINETNSFDCENAFSIQVLNNKAYIYFHISDVTYYINPKCQEFHNIIKKGCTYYGNNKKWSMLPLNYSDNICSIIPYKKSYVLTNSFIYDITLQKLEYNGWFYSIVQSKNKYNYDYINTNFNNPVFNLLYKCSLLIKNEINDIIVRNPNSNISETILHYWKIKVNKLMSSKIDNIIYLNNPIPKSHKFNIIKNYATSKNINLYINIKKRDELINFLNENINESERENNLLKYITKLLLEQCYYSIDKDSYHYQLDISDYAEFTSPINKASDLLNHCILKGFPINISNYIKYINESEFKKDIIQKFIFINNYENIKLGQTFSSTIIELNNNRITFYIEELDSKYSIDILSLSCQKLVYSQLTNSLKNSYNEYKLFDNLKVIIKNIVFDNIEFDIYSI
jgi:exoribonuclease R